MKKIKLLLIITTFTLGLLNTSVVANTIDASEKVIAVINGTHFIIKKDLDLYSTYHKEITGQTLSEQEVLQSLITSYLIVEDSKKYGYQISEKEIQETLARVASSRNLTYEEFIKNNPLMEEPLLSYMKQDLHANVFSNNLSFSQAKVSEFEISNEIDKVLSINNSKEINLIEVAIDDSNPDANNLIIEAKEEIINGSLPETVAMKYSDNIGVSQNKGNLGWILANALPTIVLLEIEKVNTNQPTDIINIDNKYKFFVKKEERRTLSVDTNNRQVLNQMRTAISQKLSYDKAEAIKQKYIKGLFQAASIEILN